uniref:DUF4160 domain-containing protein n=1 Tax=Candidatus Kentrum sp. DK TaxID=2126562 RepID=A0A450TDF5_9GAMM|nr:MAG: protein of unknown function (DUF4160) [Candidatus Kentron sp. DK]VFJ65030.1 MAG: protein of unknown function (DUF4160) [Candidatus Kentron sp. DK]
MPTVKGIPGPYRFYFYRFDGNEPRHVYIRREKYICKFWLEPLSLGKNTGFLATELRSIRKILVTAYYLSCGVGGRGSRRALFPKHLRRSEPRPPGWLR